MNVSRVLPRSAIRVASVAAALLVSPYLAAAATPTAAPREVAAAQLGELCPGADAALRGSLADAWGRVGLPAVVKVRLRVEGQRVAVISALGGWPEYRRAVRRAVRGLACDSGTAGRQSVQFAVRFAGPDEREVIAGR